MPWSDEQHSLNRRRNYDVERRTNIEKPSRQSAFNRLGRSFHTYRNTEDYTTQIHEVEEPDRSVFCRLGKKFSSNSNMEDYTTQRHEVEEPDRRSVFCRLGKFTSSNSNMNKEPYSSRTGPLQTPRQRYGSLSIAEKVVSEQRRQFHLAHQEDKSNKCFSKQDDIYDDEVEYVGYGPSSSNRLRPPYKRRRDSSSSNMERSKKSKFDEHFKPRRPVTTFRNPSFDDKYFKHRPSDQRLPSEKRSSQSENLNFSEQVDLFSIESSIARNKISSSYFNRRRASSSRSNRLSNPRWLSSRSEKRVTSFSKPQKSSSPGDSYGTSSSLRKLGRDRKVNSSQETSKSYRVSSKSKLSEEKRSKSKKHSRRDLRKTPDSSSSRKKSERGRSLTRRHPSSSQNSQNETKAEKSNLSEIEIVNLSRMSSDRSEHFKRCRSMSPIKSKNFVSPEPLSFGLKLEQARSKSLPPVFHTNAPLLQLLKAERKLRCRSLSPNFKVKVSQNRREKLCEKRRRSLSPNFTVTHMRPKLSETSWQTERELKFQFPHFQIGFETIPNALFRSRSLSPSTIGINKLDAKSRNTTCLSSTLQATLKPLTKCRSLSPSFHKLSSTVTKAEENKFRSQEIPNPLVKKTMAKEEIGPNDNVSVHHSKLIQTNSKDIKISKRDKSQNRSRHNKRESSRRSRSSSSRNYHESKTKPDSSSSKSRKTTDTKEQSLRSSKTKRGRSKDKKKRLQSIESRKEEHRAKKKKTETTPERNSPERMDIDTSYIANLVVKNLDSSVDNETLHKVFVRYGTVVSSKVAIDDNGSSMGFGYVRYDSAASANYAIKQTKGKELRQKKLRVEKFLPRSERFRHRRQTRPSRDKTLSDMEIQDAETEVKLSYNELNKKIQSTMEYIVQSPMIENKILLSYIESMLCGNYRAYSEKKINEILDGNNAKGRFTRRNVSIVLVTKTILSHLQCCKLLEDTFSYKELECPYGVSCWTIVAEVLKPVIKKESLKWLGYTIKNGKVTIASFVKTDIEKACLAFQDFKEDLQLCDTFKCNSSTSSFIAQRYSTISSNISFSITDEGVSLIGKERKVKEVKQLLERKVFITRSIEYTAPSLSEYFSGKSWRDFVEEVESEFGVLVSLQQDIVINSKKHSKPEVFIEVCQGNVAEESTDAIFNGVSENFDLNWGKVSPALLSKGGNQLQIDCATNPLVNTTYIRATKGYNLPCIYVIHIVTPDSLKDLTERVKSALNHAQDLGATSVSMPTLGAGGIGLNPSDVGKAMNEAISQFKDDLMTKYLLQRIVDSNIDSSNVQDTSADASLASSEATDTNNVTITGSSISVKINKVNSLKAATQSQSLTFINKIRIVVFDPLLLPIFQKEIPSNACKEEVKELGSIAQKWNVSITGSAGGQLNQAYTCISQERWNVFRECNISEAMLSEIEENERAEIDEMARKCGVTCKIFETESPHIVVYGVTKNVNEMEEKIKNLLAELAEASILSKISTWKWEKVPGGEIINLPIRVSRIMSINYKKSQTCSCIVSICCKKALMDFTAMTFTYGNKTGKIFQIENQAANLTPQDWAPMANESKGRYEVPANTQEYVQIVKHFQKSNPIYSSIVKIERIQDVALFRQYQIKKEDVAKHMLDSSQPVERKLFHGTTRDDAMKICVDGFDRGFAGKNATMYGRGTYFAVSSSYSASSTYCRADYSGLKYMFLALVLTGNFCQGSSSYIAAPPLNSTTGRLYDSVVDNVSSPNMFVVFKDTSVYPEYLITFR